MLLLQAVEVRMGALVTALLAHVICEESERLTKFVSGNLPERFTRRYFYQALLLCLPCSIPLPDRIEASYFINGRHRDR